MTTLKHALTQTADTRWSAAATRDRMVREVSRVLSELPEDSEVDQRLIDKAVAVIHRLWPNPSTARRVGNNLKAVVSTAQRYGSLSPTLKVPAIRAQVKRREPVGEGAIDAIRDAYAGTRFELPLELLINCGLRGIGEELRRIHRSDFDTERGLLTVRSLKGGYEISRLVPVSKKILALLPATTGRLFSDSLVRAFSDSFGRKFPRVQAYQFRHAFCTRLINAGVALPTVQAVMGHTDIATTLAYTHTTSADIAALNHLS